MNLYHLALTVPLVMLFAGIEWGISVFLRKPVFKWKDSVLNLSCGLMERGLSLAYIGAMYFVYEWMYEAAACWPLPASSWISWALAIVVFDFLYYWHHRISHTVNLYWAAHVTHHSSNEFNYTVSFRNSFFPMLLKTITFALMPIMGFSPAMIMLGAAVNGIYQFFVHTRLVGKLGPLEWVMVTPSAHRVHHACNAQYLDKNFGAVFILWDRLFHTYEEEVEEPRYGITHPLKTNSPVWAYLHYWNDLLIVSRHVKGWWNKVKWWFASPASTYARFGEWLDQEGSLKTSDQTDLRVSWRLVLYQFLQLGVLVVGLFQAYYYKDFIPMEGKLVLAAWFTWSSASLSLLLTLPKENCHSGEYTLNNIFGFTAALCKALGVADTTCSDAYLA
jgi:alkylglycerol monooxygenase